MDGEGYPHSGSWTTQLRNYARPDDRRAVLELIATLVPLVTLWVGMWHMAAVHTWLPLLIAPLAALLLVRLFMIQHDCGHGAFFSARTANDWTGRVLGVLTLTPYDVWRHSHALHHAGSGNLGRRGIGDIDTLTVEEYRARSRWGRLRYRIYRHPLIMFGVGPAYLFLLQNRLPLGALKMRTAGRMQWTSSLLTNAGILMLGIVLVGLTGWKTFLLVHGPIVLIAATIGVWLFYVQHQIERTYWETSTSWSHHDAALHGSSFYDLPQPLMWLTAHIGVHHVHHLASRIPFYRLSEVLIAHPEFRNIGRMSIWESLDSVQLTLWDAEHNRLIPFKALKSDSV